MFQKIYPLLLVFFIGIIFAQDAPPSDTEDQKDIEASEDQNAVPEDQGVVPEDQGSVPEDQNVASEETVPMKSDEKPTKEKNRIMPWFGKARGQLVTWNFLHLLLAACGRWRTKKENRSWMIVFRVF